MNIFFTCLFIGISLSMDAFSLAIIYGTYGIKQLGQILLALIVGVFHFFMPLIGLCFGNYLMKYFVIHSNLVVSFIFFIIGLEMVLSIKNDDNIRPIHDAFGYFLFGLTVSLDSLTTGIGLAVITHQYLMASTIFMITSGMFTYMGLKLGNFLNKSFGKYACFIGGMMMIFLSIYHLFSV